MATLHLVRDLLLPGLAYHTSQAKAHQVLPADAVTNLLIDGTNRHIEISVSTPGGFRMSEVIVREAEIQEDSFKEYIQERMLDFLFRASSAIPIAGRARPIGEVASDVVDSLKDDDA